jgi:hypothetical protein
MANKNSDLKQAFDQKEISSIHNEGLNQSNSLNF